MTISYSLAVARLLPDALYSQFDTYDNLVRTWYDPRPVPTEIELEQAWADIQAEETAKAADETASQTEMSTFILDIQPMLDRIATAQTAILDDQTQIDADLLILAASPTNAQIVQVLKHTINRQNGILNRQDSTLNRQGRLIKMVARLRQKIAKL